MTSDTNCVLRSLNPSSGNPVLLYMSISVNQENVLHNLQVSRLISYRRLSLDVCVLPNQYHPFELLIKQWHLLQLYHAGFALGNYPPGKCGKICKIEVYLHDDLAKKNVMRIFSAIFEIPWCLPMIDSCTIIITFFFFSGTIIICFSIFTAAAMSMSRQLCWNRTHKHLLTICLCTRVRWVC